jgi:pteridine reductase
VAKAVLFLAESGFVTGAILPVDGGRHLAGRA